MKKIIMLLILCFFLIACSTSENEIIYNSNINYLIFEHENKVYYSGVVDRDWFVYDLKTNEKNTLSADVTTKLTDFGFSVTPAKDGVYKFNQDIRYNTWKIEKIKNGNAIPRILLDSKNISLMDEEFSKYIFKHNNDTKENKFDPEGTAFENTLNASPFPFNGKIYQPAHTILYEMDLNGRNQKVVPIQLNYLNPNLGFKEDLIYYIDTEFNLMCYDNKESIKILENVYEFNLEKNGIYFSDLSNQSYNFYDFETEEVKKLMDGYKIEMKSDSKYVYYYDETIAFKLKRYDLNTQEVSFVADNVIRYLVLEDTIFIVDKNSNTKLIPK